MVIVRGDEAEASEATTSVAYKSINVSPTSSAFFMTPPFREYEFADSPIHIGPALEIIEKPGRLHKSNKREKSY